ncbi:MAG TPA: apolipoprotein N-acyltransferase, partial [Burkholderiaceae bacterium]|nr:apolipoprotein N-acyltransferase [Burkholderiaceae bacterium]
MPPSLALSLDQRLAPLLCLLAGLCSVFAFAPFGLWPLQFFTQALLFYIASRTSTRTMPLRRTLLLGWTYGFGCFVFGVYWPYVSMHNYGDMSPPLAALAVVLFSLLLGVFSGLAMVGANWLRRRWQAGNGVSFLVIFPASWMLSEWLRDWIFTGFPWLANGYAHTNGPLAGFAPVAGVFGVSWVAAIIAGSIALAPEHRRALALAMLLLATGWGLKSIDWTHPSGQAISVRLLQGNVPQEEKFQSNHLDEALAMYDTMLRAKPADLIATPESAIAVLPQQLPPDYIPRLVAFAKQTNSHLALGMFMSDWPGVYTNSVVDLSPHLTAATLYKYDKHHLVPFGEFVPYGFHWFVAMLQIPLGDMSSGAPIQAPFAVKDQWILPNICYEDVFGEEIAAEIADAYFAHKPQATILLNVSNMAWFGQWLAVPQHLQTSQMRALETGRTALRATNTGATALIDPHGVVSAQLAPYTR